MNLLRISATAHGINYLPQYVAAASGAFARRGLEVQAWPREPWDGVLHDLERGEADLVLGGIWGPAMFAGTGRDLVSIGQVNARFPMTVITRQAAPGFTWSALEGTTVLVAGQGGTAPYEFTAGLMREHGADPAATKFVRDLSMPMLVELFTQGLGDAIVADPLTATTLVRGGQGHPACRLADAGGPMPNSVYYTERSRLDELHERCVALMGGIAEAMQALRGGADPAGVIAAEWPDGPQEDLLETARTMAANGTWSNIRIEPAALDRWVWMLHDRGLTLAPAPYDALVDVRVADAVDAAPAGSAA